MMKKNKSIFRLFLLLEIAIFLVSGTACNKSKDHMETGKDEYYTCSMDPQVIEYKDGNCPICHMKLIRVKNNQLQPGQIKLSNQQIKLANITYDTIRIRELAKEITLTGRITIDQNLSDAISSRVPGRIEKLGVKSTGDFIHKGAFLYSIYSEELNAVQQEYVMAYQKETLSFRDKNEALPLLDAAKNKLLLDGMSESQIRELEISKQVLQAVPVYSTTDGFVNELSVTEGSYVSSGTTLFRLASLHSLWVEAEVYLPYLPYLKEGSEATFFIPAAGDSVFHGKAIFIDPQVQSPDRFVLARFKMDNLSSLIKPGMLANISLQTEKIKSLTLPIDALIQDSKGANVWVRKQDGVFENKMVKTGMQNSREIEITDGLTPGEVVVITGAYLLNSEYIFKKGANPMEGHQDMHGIKM